LLIFEQNIKICLFLSSRRKINTNGLKKHIIILTLLVPPSLIWISARVMPFSAKSIFLNLEVMMINVFHSYCRTKKISLKVKLYIQTIFSFELTKHGGLNT